MASFLMNDNKIKIKTKWHDLDLIFIDSRADHMNWNQPLSSFRPT